MAKEKDTGKELSEMLRGVPPKNILISFGDEPPRSLEERLKELEQEKRQKKKRGERDSR